MGFFTPHLFLVTCTTLSSTCLSMFVSWKLSLIYLAWFFSHHLCVRVTGRSWPLPPKWKGVYSVTLAFWPGTLLTLGKATVLPYTQIQNSAKVQEEDKTRTSYQINRVMNSKWMNEHTAFIKNPKDRDWVIFSIYCLKSRSASLAMKLSLWCLYVQWKGKVDRKKLIMCAFIMQNSIRFI